MKERARAMMTGRGAEFGRVACWAILAVSISACGFHLRGAEMEHFPPEVRELRVVVQGSREAYSALRLSVQSALQRAGVTVMDSGSALLLTLIEENFDNQVLSVNAAGLGREYLIRYEVTYRLTDTAGKERIKGETVRVLRELLVEPAAILAREIEERELRDAMRQEAARQIVLRLSRALTVPAAPAK